MKALFQLRPDADLDMLVNHLGLLIGQAQAVQSSVFELSCGRHEIAANFEEINALVSLTENHLEQMMQISEYLNKHKLKVVKS